MLKLKKADDIIDIVIQELKSFKTVGLIDRSILYRHIENLNKFFLPKFIKEKKTVLEINDYKSELPNDFKKLIFACGFFKYEIETFKNNRQGILIKEETFCAEYKNKDECNIFIDECDNEVKLTQYLGTNETRLYYNNFPICIKKQEKNFCIDECVNLEKKCISHIEIIDNYVITNFEKGYICLTYIPDAVNEKNELLVPDDSIILNFYIDKLKYIVIEDIYLNGQADVVQRLSLLKNNLIDSEGRAKSYYKQSEYKDFINFHKWLKNKYLKFHNVLNNAKSKSTSDYYYGTKFR